MLVQDISKTTALAIFHALIFHRSGTDAKQLLTKKRIASSTVHWKSSSWVAGIEKTLKRFATGFPKTKPKGSQWWMWVPGKYHGLSWQHVVISSEFMDPFRHFWSGTLFAPLKMAERNCTHSCRLTASNSCCSLLFLAPGVSRAGLSWT